MSKNCGPWAETYFKDKLAGVKASSNNVSVETNNVTEVSGDVELNQRKGKLITIFDVAITLTWKGDVDGNNVEGTIKFPEYMSDQDFDDLDVEVAVTEGASADKDACKVLIKKEVLPVLIEKLKAFPSDMLASMYQPERLTLQGHTKDVYIQPEDMNGHPANTPYKPQPVANPTTSTAHAPVKVKGSTVTFEQDVDFHCSAQDLYNVFTDQNRVKIWSRSPDAQVSTQPGSLFSLFGGQVTGFMVEAEPDKKISQRWRIKTWPASHFAVLTFTFSQSADGTKLQVKAQDVPVGEVDAMKANLLNYYYNPIKSTFGYGALL